MLLSVTLFIILIAISLVGSFLLLGALDTYFKNKNRRERYFEFDIIMEDWIRASTNKSVYYTDDGIDLCMGKFHSGTTFKAKVLMNESDASELRNAKKNGFEPVFIVSIK